MKFVLTKELGRLAKWLRILGFDTEYYQQSNVGSLIIQALREERIIISRNHHLPQGRGINIVCLSSEKIAEQLNELLNLLKLKPEPDMMFSRCTICNLELKPIDKPMVKDKVPEYVFQTQEVFVRCPQCSRVYWQGTHWGNVEKALKGIHGIYR
jgi:uncharacterized protein with PIN domain